MAEKKSATSQIISYIKFMELRFGRAPKVLRLSLRTVKNLGRENDPMPRNGSLPLHIDETRLREWVQSARLGQLEFCGIPVELID